MADFKTLTAKECALELLKIERPLVLMHARPDGDTVGSCAALCKVFRMLGKEPRYLCADPIPERLAFLLKNEREASADELSSLQPVAVDIASAAQLGGIKDKIPAPLLMIDHHELGMPFADNFIVHGESSGAEVVMQVCEELISMGKISMTRELAYPLYAGISSDTGSFRYSLTKPQTMRRAASLMEYGINFSDINHRLFSSKSRAGLAAEGYIAENLKTAADGKVAYASVTRATRAALSAEMSDFETAVDVIRSLAGVEISFVIKETDSGEFRASIRSTGADVAKICAYFGGGGHIRAAGCSLFVESAEEAERLVLEKILSEYY